MEALLRPPVELWSTATAFAAGTLAWLAPWALMMPPGIAMATGLTFFGFGLWLFFEARNQAGLVESFRIWGLYLAAIFCFMAALRFVIANAVYDLWGGRRK